MIDKNPVPEILRSAAQYLRHHEGAEVTDALRWALHPGTNYDVWHLPPQDVASYELAYVRVIEHYRGAVSHADRDPDVAAVLEKLAEKSELEGEGRRR